MTIQDRLAEYELFDVPILQHGFAPFIEVQVETNVFRLQLIFHDLAVHKVSDEVTILDKIHIPIKNC